MADKVGIRAATIVLKDGKVLLVKSKYQNEEFYLFPGGGMEFGETAEACAARETLEETGVNVCIKDLFHVNEYIYRTDWNKRSISLFFIAEVLDISNPETNDEGKIKEVEWVDLGNLDKIEVKPKKVAEMLSESLDLSSPHTLYSIDFKE